MHHLCRRHASHVLITVGAGRHNGANQYTPGTLGVHSQSGKLGDGALPKDDVPRLSCGHCVHDPGPSRGEAVENSPGLLQSIGSREADRPMLGQIDWKDVPGHHASTTV